MGKSKKKKKKKKNKIKFKKNKPKNPKKQNKNKTKPKTLGERFCTLCNNCQIGDEFHYILECDTIQNIRKYFL